MLATAKAWLGRTRASCDQPEFEQGFIRLAAALIVLVCFAVYVSRDGTIDEREWLVMPAVLAYLAASVALLAWMFAFGRVSPVRRYAGIIVDNLGITYFMAMMGEVGAVVFGFYLFIIFG